MAAAAEFAGVSRQSFSEWLKLAGFPQPTADASGAQLYDVWAIAQWKWQADHPVDEENEDEFAGAKSPHLERGRAYDADMKKIKRDLMRGSLVEVATVVDLHGKLASLDRSFCEWIDLQEQMAVINKFQELLENKRDLVNQFCDSIGTREITDDAYGSIEEDVSQAD